MITDSNACTTDACDPTTGVSHVPVVINDSNACTTDACDPTTGVSHVPVVINDTRLVMRKGVLAAMPGDVWVEVLSPVATAGYTRENVEELITTVRELIVPRVRHD